MKIRNSIVYIATIKKCLDYDNYKKFGDKRNIVTIQIKTPTKTLVKEMAKNYAEIVSEQNIVIKTKHDKYYRFKLTNTFFDNIKIKFENPVSSIPTVPTQNNDIFLDENTIIPFYKEQPKILSLKKLQKDLLLDSRIKIKIDK